MELNGMYTYVHFMTLYDALRQMNITTSPTLGFFHHVNSRTVNDIDTFKY